MNQANHRLREACMVCEGKGRDAAQAGQPCSYCSGTGYVFARCGAPEKVLLATGDCRQPRRMTSLKTHG